MSKIDFTVNKVTPLSKTIALILFILLPFIGFVLGMKYQKTLDIIQMNSTSTWAEKSDFDNKKPNKETENSYKTNLYEDPDSGYMKEMIVVDAPKPNDIVTSPITISGKARGTWFFEGSFPITLYCGTDNKIAQHYATTQEDWMTEDFINFTATLTFTDNCDTTGILELTKDNPSGLKELDDKVLIPVRFSE